MTAATALIDDLLKWERSRTVAVWEGKSLASERYTRARDAARSKLEGFIVDALRVHRRLGASR